MSGVRCKVSGVRSQISHVTKKRKKTNYNIKSKIWDSGGSVINGAIPGLVKTKIKQKI